MAYQCYARGGNPFWGVTLTGVFSEGWVCRPDLLFVRFIAEILAPDIGRLIWPDWGRIDIPLLTKNMMRSWFLLFWAKDMQVSFIFVVAWILALYWMRSSAISLLPRVQANIRGVLPNLSVYSISAPSSISPRTQVNLLCSMARDIGVLPSLSTGSTLAP